MASNLEATGKPNLTTSTDTELTTPQTVPITDQNADLTFSKSASDAATSTTNLHVAPFAISSNASATRKSSESTFRTGEFLFVVDTNAYILLLTKVYKITFDLFSHNQNVYCHRKCSGRRSPFNQAWGP